ncbi:hypothetical protein LAUMK7_01589 [Mycobacterium kansasii]|uniref:Uncharacterized protein n=1 Tax=Mycobacterium kansasii TaxID=1768 RepID=A0A653F5N8_MYCKA|nr:hypothetical protein MKANGN_01250 [Mycobacterium kansasii]VAZ59168.1 hypothetical protein LAUMK22_00962 [Mycobacterium kansasii]VAZ65484.1 hypothetical protein LAUMK40_01609 [Mycobacterium kansasii]VAZ72906.1 hypothetical protein LAUMK7_01589 [Mycobacterium kansasii]VTP04913.1 hypothetical protein BIN_B_04753 [Mycobacterium kansasii]
MPVPPGSPRVRRRDMSTPWQPPTYPPGPPAYAQAGVPPNVRRPSGVRRAGLIAAVVVSVFGAGIAGVIVGAHISSAPGGRAAESSTAAPPSPSPEQIRTQTIDLCTRFAAGYAMLPSPPKTAADIGPAANYIADALRDNGFADHAIRTAIGDSLRLYRDRAAMVSRESAQGAIQLPNSWTPDAANAADDRVWSLCHQYQG